MNLVQISIYVSEKVENTGYKHFLTICRSTTLPKTNFSFFSCIYLAVCKYLKFGLA